ncbi:cuticle collagen 2-like [Amphibalanus amphitrite]|uniref:cuticle collagen 2-like n=1 Tax=Amphibalanus amphitrite TaxID=1232801 RepID=UPI001C8FB256|nr:cuticle collagen 2-like [Amphibalanus amphitrite]
MFDSSGQPSGAAPASGGSGGGGGGGGRAALGCRVRRRRRPGADPGTAPRMPQRGESRRDSTPGSAGAGADPEAAGPAPTLRAPPNESRPPAARGSEGHKMAARGETFRDSGAVTQGAVTQGVVMPWRHGCTLQAPPLRRPQCVPLETPGTSEMVC